MIAVGTFMMMIGTNPRLFHDNDWYMYDEKRLWVRTVGGLYAYHGPLDDTLDQHLYNDDWRLYDDD